MKKFAALILVLLLATPAALAGNLPIGGGLKETPAPEATEAPVATAAPEETQAPEATPATDDGDILTDPEARYEDFVNPSDPASVWFLRMLDSVNDEAALVPDGMALERVDYAVDGEETLASTMRLYDTQYGLVMEIDDDPEYPGMVMYIFPDVTAILYNGAAMTSDGGYDTDDELPGPSNFLNTYDPAETLIAVRAEGDGFAYLTDGGNGMFFEYLTDATLKFYVMRAYEADADGVMRLTQYAQVNYVEAPALPEALTDALAGGSAQ